MKAQVLQENLAKAVSICSRFTSQRIQLPVLANTLFKTNKNKLIVAATNLEMSVSVSIGAKIEKEGEITIPSRVVNDLLLNLKPGQVKLEEEKEILKIATDEFESSVSGMNASDFPEIPEEVGVDSVEISSQDISDALNKSLFAVSIDETRPVLTGILVIMRDSEMVFVATDGFRLSQKKVRIKKSGEEKRFIIPKNVLSEVLRLSAGSDNLQFSFKRGENQIVFAIADSVLGSRLIEGDFPDFERIIPKESKIKVSLDREEFLRVIKLASVFARDAANVVKLSLGESSISVLAESSKSGSQKASVDAKVKFENGGNKDFVIAFNYRFLEDFLNAVDGDEVQMEFSEPSSPALFLDPKDTQFLHIIMPIRLQA